MPTTSPFTATATFSIPALSVNPATYSEAVDRLNDYIEVTISPEATTYITGVATPGLIDQDKLWLRLKGNGCPIGIFAYWNGFWRRTDTPRLWSIHAYSGAPSTYFNADGTGKKGLEYDGFILCDGRNGGVDMSNRFIVAADMTAGGGFSAGVWKSDVTGTQLSVGGVKDILLGPGNTYEPPTAILEVGKWQADGNAATIAGDMYGEIVGSNKETLRAASAGVANPARIPTVPPFYALAYVRFVGYDAY